jgi:hypothetical protein
MTKIFSGSKIYSYCPLFQTQKPQKKRNEDNDVENFILPFFALNQIPDDEHGYEGRKHIIE